MNPPCEDIPPYGVALEQDGCFRLWVSHPLAMGSVEDCAQFIANHLPPKGDRLCLAIYPIGEGRCPSYIIPEPTMRRYRLQWQDFQPEEAA